MQNIKIVFLLIWFNCVVLQESFAQSIIWSNFSHPQQRATYDAGFSSDGTKVLSGSECHEAHIRVFDASNGSILWDYQLDSSLFCIQGVKFSSNGSMFLAIEETGNLLVFDYSSGTPVISDTIVTGNSVALSVDINTAGFEVLLGCNNQLKVYSFTTNNFTNTIQAHNGFIWSVNYSSNEQRIVTASSDNLAKVWNSAGALELTLTGSTGDVLCAKFSKDDSLIVISGRDDKIRVYDALTGASVNVLSGHTGDVNKIDISPDNRFIASASFDASIKIWELETGTLLATIPDTSGFFVYSVEWSPDGTKLIAGNGATQVILYDVDAITGITPLSVASLVRCFPNPIKTGERMYISSETKLLVSN
jgi:WD40 repeat protein